MTEDTTDDTQDVSEGYTLDLTDDEMAEIYTVGMRAFTKTKEAILNHASHELIAYYFAWLETQLTKLTGAMPQYTIAKATARDESGLLPLSGGGDKPN